MKPKIITGPFYFTRQATGTVAQIKAKLPEMFRSGTFERAEIDQDERTVPIVFATEAPVNRWFGRERLICTPEACNIQRANNMGAFLSEHKRKRQIGVIVPNSTTFGADRKARTKLRFSKSNPLAEQEWRDLNDGIRGLFSVGYVVHRLVLREENDTEGDLYDAMEWEVLEVSLVSVPADANCTIDGRSENADNFPVLITADTEQTKTALTTMTRNARNYFARQLAPDTGANPPAPAAPKQEQERATTPANGNQPAPDNGKAEIERVRSIGFLGAKYGLQEKMLEFIQNGRSATDFKDYIMDNDIRPVDKRNADPAPGKSPLLTGNGSPQQPLARSLGQMIAESEQFREFSTAARGRRSSAFEIPGVNVRATLTTAEIPSGAVTVDRLPGIQLLEQQRLTVADLMGAGTTTSTKIHYVLEESYTNAATTVAEGAQKPEATFELTQAETSVRKIAVFAKVSDEMLADYDYIRSYIDNRMSFMVAEREEAQLLNGDGNSPNLLGIMVTPGVQTQAKGADSAVDAIHKAITKIRVTGKAEPTGVVINPADAQDIVLSKDANGQYLAGGPFFGPYGQGGYSAAQRVWGLPMVQTTAITENTALVGAFKPHSTVYRRQGITVEATNSNEDDFEKNLVTIRVESRLALVVDRPSAFCLVTGV